MQLHGHVNRLTLAAFFLVSMTSPCKSDTVTCFRPITTQAQGLRAGGWPCKHAGTEVGSTRKALLRLLRPGGALASAGAVIAYATFQMQAEQVAQFLTAHGIKAAAYHAGKHMKVRLTLLITLMACNGTVVAGRPLSRRINPRRFCVDMYSASHCECSLAKVERQSRAP